MNKIDIENIKWTKHSITGFDSLVTIYTAKIDEDILVVNHYHECHDYGEFFNYDVVKYNIFATDAESVEDAKEKCIKKYLKIKNR